MAYIEMMSKVTRGKKNSKSREIPISKNPW